MADYLKLNKVKIPEFKIFTNPMISISDITSRSFDLIDRLGITNYYYICY